MSVQTLESAKDVREVPISKHKFIDGIENDDWLPV
jgi:hypothetical protein